MEQKSNKIPSKLHRNKFVVTKSQSTHEDTASQRRGESSLKSMLLVDHIENSQGSQRPQGNEQHIYYVDTMSRFSGTYTHKPPSYTIEAYFIS
ncbi:hypothetical protein AMTR_s00088p00103440 [Amborella trichopoda]|uniref:Uncharacterized protein n=1 Tax=Amborella trichopoda TaxID=13333 RepID=W1NVA8_AMBTC|nr:hypothetical protein AMTR_s00088p00103440 [Amborella trichopoda]